MRMIRYLEDVELVKAIEVKQTNGTKIIKDYENIGEYRIQKKSLEDEVSASIYGANITRMWNIASPLGDLEEYLIPKVDNQEDNISLYYIILGNTRYKINSVKDSGIDIERV